MSDRSLTSLRVPSAEEAGAAATQWRRNWAAEVLEVEPTATADELRRAALLMLDGEDFLPTLHQEHAYAQLAELPHWIELDRKFGLGDPGYDAVEAQLRNKLTRLRRRDDKLKSVDRLGELNEIWIAAHAFTRIKEAVARLAEVEHERALIEHDQLGYDDGILLEELTHIARQAPREQAVEIGKLYQHFDTDPAAVRFATVLAERYGETCPLIFAPLREYLAYFDTIQSNTVKQQTQQALVASATTTDFVVSARLADASLASSYTTATQDFSNISAGSRKNSSGNSEQTTWRKRFWNFNGNFSLIMLIPVIIGITNGITRSCNSPTNYKPSKYYYYHQSPNRQKSITPIENHNDTIVFKMLDGLSANDKESQTISILEELDWDNYGKSVHRIILNRLKIYEQSRLSAREFQLKHGSNSPGEKVVDIIGRIELLDKRIDELDLASPQIP